MKFDTPASVKRPVRLSKETREWAWESLHGKYGTEAMQNGYLNADTVEGYGEMSDLQKYDISIRMIAEKAPIRICEHEKVSGSATLGGALYHNIPVEWHGQKMSSISHLTIDFAKVVHLGIDGYSRQIEERLKDNSLTEGQIDFLHSLQSTIDSLKIYHTRHLEAVKDTKPEIYNNLLVVPFKPAETFYQAVQCIWFVFSFVRLCGNWPGIGRIDQILGPYLEKDLNEGKLTLDEAREILASLFVKGCEWIQKDTERGSGDAQNYQNIVLAGIDCEGKEVANKVTYLVLDIVEELSISDFPISVRLNKNTPEKLLQKVARVMRHGGGIVAVYNEDVVIDGMLNDGYTTEEARKFANDGCWEVQVPGSTCFGYIPFDGLQVLNHSIGVDGNREIADCNNIDEVISCFGEGLYEKINLIYDQQVRNIYGIKDGVWHIKNECGGASVISLFENGCIENAAQYYDLGPNYTVRSPHIGGAPDVANSLYAIQKLCFEKKLITFKELCEALKNNWEGYEDIRLYAKNKLVYYGNDNDECDAYLRRVLGLFSDIVRKIGASYEGCPVKFIPGVSTFGRQIEWRPMRTAVAFGFRKGDILSGNDSPTPGTDYSGATAIVKSYCKTNLRELSCGAALDIKLFPKTICGQDGVKALSALLKGFYELGGFFMQLDVVDKAVLLAARENPEQYKTLSVRVSGWNARFVTLNREWQDMIIERSSQNV